MSDRTAATALRLLGPRAVLSGTGNPDSLQNVNTTELPNGSLCMVNESGTLYRLDKFSTATSAIPAIMQPASGPGRWFALSGGALLAAARMSMFSPDEPTLAVGQGNQDKWLALPVDEAGPYGPQVTGNAFWDINSDTGVATYLGPDQIYHFVASMNIAVDAEATTEAMLSLTLNGEDIGTTNGRGLQERCAPFDADHFQIISLAIEMVVHTNDTVQLIVRNSTGEDNLILAGIQMTGLPAGEAPVIT